MAAPFVGVKLIRLAVFLQHCGEIEGVGGADHRVILCMVDLDRAVEIFNVLRQRHRPPKIDLSIRAAVNLKNLPGALAAVRSLCSVRGCWRTVSVVRDALAGEIIITVHSPGPHHPGFDFWLNEHGAQNQVASHAVTPHPNTLGIDEIQGLQAL